MTGNYSLALILIALSQWGIFSEESEKSYHQNQSVQTFNDSIEKSIHILVALCDNYYQGIVKVPQGIGNGQKPKTNLYWGCGYGIKTFFKKSAEWTLLRTISFPMKNDSVIMERLIFKNKSKNCYLIADAYNGMNIKRCTQDFFFSNSGQLKDTIQINKRIIGTHGNSELIAYIGHNGLMDFNFTDSIFRADNKQRNCIILACKSKSYYKDFVTKTGSNPLLWTTNYMCPEAYTVHDAISAYLSGSNPETIRIKAAEAYNKYQKCGINGAKKLLVTGY
jgi:hypothetical protein